MQYFGPSLLKKVFPPKNRKSEHHHWILHILISLGTKFPLKLTVLIFLTRFVQKGFFWSKTEKWTQHIFYIIPHIQINLVQNFSSNWQFWFFGANLPKKVFPVENRKSEHHHEVLYIWISLGTKFQLKLIILSFQTKFTQRRHFQLKTEQAVQGYKCLLFV